MKNTGQEKCERLVHGLSARARKLPDGPNSKKLVLVAKFLLQATGPLVFNDDVGFDDKTVVDKATTFINQVIFAAQDWVNNGNVEAMSTLRQEPSETFWQMVDTLSECEEGVAKMVDCVMEATLNLDPDWSGRMVPKEELKMVQSNAITGIEDMFEEHVQEALCITPMQIDWDNFYILLREELEKFDRKLP